MSETVMTNDDAVAHVTDLVERVHTKGESAVRVKAGKPMARIVPLLAPGEVADACTFLRRWRNEFPAPDERCGLR